MDFFFIDTTTFVDEYWGPSPGHVFDWRGLAPRENQLKSQLEVRVQDKVTSRIGIVHFVKWGYYR